MHKKRVYEKDYFNPAGIPEDETRCIVPILQESGFSPMQCSRKRGHGIDDLYCKQHSMIGCMDCYGVGRILRKWDKN